MSKKDTSFDELYEALSIDKQYIEVEDGPPEIWRGRVFSSYWWSRNKTADAPKDIIYLNKEGKLHRIYGPARISEYFQLESWFKNGVYHREGGPAIKHKKNEYWMYEGKFHRLDGPAIITGGGPKEYWIMGQRLSPKEYKKEIDRRKRKGLIK